MRGRNQLEQASGTIPRRAKTKPILAPSAARRMSIGSVIVMPTPTAGPLIAAITGLVESKMRSATCAAAVARDLVRPSCRSRQSNVSPPPPRSAPAQKPLPSPVTITARTSSSASALVERLDQLAPHRRRERVEPLGPVERDRQDVIGDLVADLLEVHGLAFRSDMGAAVPRESVVPVLQSGDLF